MGKSEGVKPTKSGYYWCNVHLKNGQLKLCIAKLADKETMLFSVFGLAPHLKDEPNWIESKEKPGWYQIDLYEEEINQFFDWNFKS